MSSAKGKRRRTYRKRKKCEWNQMKKITIAQCLGWRLRLGNKMEAVKLIAPPTLSTVWAAKKLRVEKQGEKGGQNGENSKLRTGQ